MSLVLINTLVTESPDTEAKVNTQPNDGYNFGGLEKVSCLGGNMDFDGII